MAFLLGTVASWLVTFVFFVYRCGSEYWQSYAWWSLLVAATYYLPSILALAAVWKRFTWKRLAVGLVASLLLVYATVTALGWASENALNVPPVLPYPVVFFLFATFNPWCRQGLIRAWGLNRERAASLVTPPEPGKVGSPAA